MEVAALNIQAKFKFYKVKLAFKILEKYSFSLISCVDNVVFF